MRYWLGVLLLTLLGLQQSVRPLRRRGNTERRLERGSGPLCLCSSSTAPFIGYFLQPVHLIS